MTFVFITIICCLQSKRKISKILMARYKYKDHEIISEKISVYERTRELFKNKIYIACLTYDTMLRYTMLRLNYSA